MSLAPSTPVSRLSSILLAVLPALLPACGGGGGGGASGQAATPALQSVSLIGPTYAAVGEQQHFTALGHYSDGNTAPLTTGVSWASSDHAVASVDGSGVVAPWSQGEVQLTATDDATGLSAHAGLTARAVTLLAADRDLPASGQVDTATTLFKVGGLTPGAMYAPAISGMSDDVDLTVFSDISLAPDTRLCRSAHVGADAESCVAPATAAGELWIAVDGQWTRSGASFRVEVPAAEPGALAATLAFPAQVPHAGAAGAARYLLKLVGLAPGAAYQVRLSSAADLDLAVYADPYAYGALCLSYQEGSGNEECNVQATAAGELVVEIDGESSPAGGAYTLDVTPK